MQEQIRSIITSDLPYEEKIQALAHVFSLRKDLVFSDLDDTITDNQSLLYGRLALIRLLFGKSLTYESIAFHMAQYGNINPQFLSLCKEKGWKEIVIISRNNHLFIEEIIPYLQQKLAPQNITLIASIGRHRKGEKGFSLTSRDKIRIVPVGAPLISDIFEFSVLKEYPFFFSVDGDTSPVRRYGLLVMKYVQLLGYTFFLLFRGKSIFHS